MQYSVRNRRRLRQTGDVSIPRTETLRGTGVTNADAPTVVRAEGSGVVRTIGSACGPVKEITPAAVIKNNWQR